MFPAKTRLVAVVAATLFLASGVRADYVSATVPLTSNSSGQTVGTMVAEADTGTTANGLQPGQVRLTFTVNPVPAYTQNGASVGFSNVVFNTDLPLSSSQVSATPGWSVSASSVPSLGSPASNPSAPGTFEPWNVTTTSGNAGGPSVAVLISGLGNLATLDHFTTSVQYGLPNVNPPPFIVNGTVLYPGANGQPQTDFVTGNSVNSAPEPSTLALGAVGLVGAAFVRRWRAKARR